MILTIAYKSGENRVINLHPDFFTSTQLDFFNKKTGKVEVKVFTPSDKAVSLAESLSYQPYVIHLERNGSVQMHKKIPTNEPIPAPKLLKINEKKVKKDLRMLHKHESLRRKDVKFYVHASY